MIELPVDALAAACYAVGISPDHAGSGRYARALTAALPYIEREILRELVAVPATVRDSDHRTTFTKACERLNELTEEIGAQP